MTINTTELQKRKISGGALTPVVGVVQLIGTVDTEGER